MTPHPSPRVIPCSEQGQIDLPLSELIDGAGTLLLNPEISKKDFLTVTLRGGKLRLQARGFIGLIPLNERLAIFVEPRVPVSNLTRMAEISGSNRLPLPVIRAYETGEAKEGVLRDLYAAALVHHVERVVERGLLREYRRVEEESSFPAGGLLVNQTVRMQARGVKHRVWSSRYERTADNAVNRCLKYALWRVGRQGNESAALGKQIRRQLNRLYASFEGVSLDRSLAFLNDDLVTGRQGLPPVRAYYRDALDVARAALLQRKIFLDRSATGVQLPSIVFDMNDLFERYVRRTLEMHGASAGWTEIVADGNTTSRRLLFMKHRAVGSGFHQLQYSDAFATPDIVVLRENGDDVACVMDVKNKLVKRRSDRDGEDQVIAYALRYATDRVVLVHPAQEGQKPGMYKVGDVGEVSLFQYRMNLAADDPEVEERNFGDAVAKLIAS
ncbi:McrC family protein [Streptomyces sp. SudanB182_2057]|uniref:McrC family protein n=1 Tax=Streptomyces sp. SudanB182_2057 TaxID=3035281 RepID=UPI003F577ED6